MYVVPRLTTHSQPPNIVATNNSLLNQVQGSFNLNRSNSDQRSDSLCFIHNCTSIDSHSSIHCSVLVASASNIGIVCNRKPAFDQSGNFQPAMGTCLVSTCAVRMIPKIMSHSYNLSQYKRLHFI